MEIFRSHSELKGGEFCYYIDPDSFKVKWAQWRADKLGKIGQYPDPQDGLKFGKAPQEKNQNSGELTATVKGFAYTSFGDNSSWVSSDSVVDRLVYDTLKEKLALREKIAPDESKPQILGPAYEVKLADVTLVTSDRSDAPLIVNGEYCRCEYAENLFAELTSPMRSIDSFSVLSNEGGECDADLGDHSEELCRWYEDFLSKKQEPLTDVGSVVHTPETKYAKFMFNDTQVIVANTKYSKANVQINGQFYHLDDPVPLGIIDKAYAEKQSME